MYWLLVPKHKRRKCLFKKSCSNYVYDITKSEGFISGLKALRFRMCNCNPYHSIMELDGQNILITKTNETLQEHEINPSILKDKPFN